jgi:ubiquinone/menaquinone biosynthesis C-methylase UbiE
MAESWSDNLSAELAFWEQWLTQPKYADVRALRMEALKQFPQYYIDKTSCAPGSTVNALDVGSGPITTLGYAAKGYDLTLACTDALGNEYNSLLEKLALTHLMRIQAAKGEQLLEWFGASKFDIVHCANALDHFEAPKVAFENMYSVCKPGGALIVISIENEGEREGYSGLHQWNLKADDEGLWLGSKSGSENLLDVTRRTDVYNWEMVNRTSDFNVFRAIIQKKI